MSTTLLVGLRKIRSSATTSSKKSWTVATETFGALDTSVT